MAHGAGGKATQGMIEGAVRARVRVARPRTRWATPALFAVDGVELALTTDSFVVKPIASPAARSATWPSTAPSTTLPWRAPVRWR